MLDLAPALATLDLNLYIAQACQECALRLHDVFDLLMKPETLVKGLVQLLFCFSSTISCWVCVGYWDTVDFHLYLGVAVRALLWIASSV
jgi:hypothetical protein